LITFVLNVRRGDLAGEGEKMLGETASKLDVDVFKFADVFQMADDDVLLVAKDSSLFSGRRRLARYDPARRDTLKGGGGVEKSGGVLVKSGPPETGKLFLFTSKVMLGDFFIILDPTFNLKLIHN